MQKLLAEEHPELFHYTNATGLAGIIQSQTLWATHYAYLNDSEEMQHFHKNRLPNLLQNGADKGLDELIAENPGKQLIDKEKIIEGYVQATLTDLENILWNNRDDKVPLAEPYVTSFCSTKDKDERIKNHGLLSQWRGYGRDGGYAIVFDTVCLLLLLEEARAKWENSGYLFLEDIVYSSDDSDSFVKFKQELIEIEDFSLNRFRGREKSNNSENLFSALMKCACLYKHWGFKEENEVRIVAIPHPTNNRKFCEFAEKTYGKTFQEILRKHYLRSDTLVPYIDLF